MSRTFHYYSNYKHLRWGKWNLNVVFPFPSGYFNYNPITSPLIRRRRRVTILHSLKFCRAIELLCLYHVSKSTASHFLVKHFIFNAWLSNPPEMVIACVIWRLHEIRAAWNAELSHRRKLTWDLCRFTMDFVWMSNFSPTLLRYNWQIKIVCF